MWNDKKSLVLSKACVVAFMVLLVACVFIVPAFFGSFLLDIVPEKQAGGLMVTREASQQLWFFRITVYSGSIPAGIILVCLHLLLTRISKGDVFVKKNVDALRYISWCCFAGAVISLVSMYYWIPWSAVSIAAAFMGLIVRVVKNVIAKAVSLQDDANLTI